MACKAPKRFSSSRLNVVTWNIAECIASAAAPASWTHVVGFDERLLAFSEPGRNVSTHASEAIKAAILYHDPDVICLQESPGKAWASTEFGAGYSVIGATRSHCGTVVLLLKAHLLELVTAVNVTGPSVAVQLKLPGAPAITIASSHLSPSKEGAAARLGELTTLVNEIPTANFILCGDMNMRTAEDNPAQGLGGGLTDAWKVSGSSPEQKMTWNSFVNKYHANGFEFTARYDRIYTHGPAVHVENFGLVGSEPIGDSESHYLSDHFGIVCELRVE
jgi:endonuclease/exonuclease/phosphatase family metal-dependent hydrolase